jgi:homoserine kinase type II
MASYTSISLAQAEEILSLYGQYKILSLTPLSLGISNSNYKIELEDHSPMVLKISNDKNTNDLREEQKILNFLSQHHFPYSLVPYLTKKGDLIYELSPYYGVLFPFVAGDIPSINSHTCYEIGRGLASLHSLKLREGASTYVRSFEVVGFGANQIKNYLLHSECPQDFKEIFQDIFPDALETYLQSNIPEGLIHGDLYYDNTLFNEQGLKMILDFEQGGMGPYLFDLGISISGTCLLDGQIHPPYVDYFLKGYNSLRKLDELELALVNTTILLGLYSIGLWRIKRFNERKLDPKKKDNYKELILRAQNYYRRIKKDE